MSESTRPYDPSNIYGKLNSQDVEQFYAGYQLWQIQQQALSLEAQIEDLRREIALNAELMQRVHLPAIALATVARLQASGVNDIALLDRMLERGEEWLDRTMQHLDYCEQLDFMIDDYTQWCQNALEGAYDWIDSMREGATPSSPQAPTGGTEAPGEATEELLLQKLTSEEDEQSPSPDTAHPQAETSQPQEPTSAPPELPINTEQSAATSVGATFMAPQNEVGETVFAFETTIPQEDIPTSEEQITTIEEPEASIETPHGLEETTSEVQEPAHDTKETSSDLEETASEVQEEQVPQLSQLSQLSQVPQSVEADTVSEPLETSPATDISTETEQTIEEETSSSHDTPINPPPLDAPPGELSPLPDSLPSTVEASENVQPTSKVDGVADEDELASTSLASENVQPTSPMDGELNSAPAEPLHTQSVSEIEQPVSEKEAIENTEQGSMREMTPHRHHNFLQRLAAKILGS